MIKQIRPLTDVVSERLIISCILRHGEPAYSKISFSLNESHFSDYSHQLIFSAVQSLIEEKKSPRPSLGIIVATIRDIDSNSIEKYNIPEYLSALISPSESVTVDELDPLCQKLLKLSSARELKHRLETAANDLEVINGSESLAQIISLAESPVIEFVGSLMQTDDIIHLGEQLDEHVQILATCPQSSMGIPSGFSAWDMVIGGGIRRPGFVLVGGRSKSGKSFFCLNVAEAVTRLGLPVLYLDTELDENITMNRWLSRITGLDTLFDIESGLFAKDSNKSTIVQNAVKSATTQKFYYKNIAGKPHEEWLSIMRRWIMKEVGFNDSGKANDCLIILDYLKSMNLDDFGKNQEFQYLGQVATDLHNFCTQYGIGMLVTCQLNRDGITNEHQGVISGSDRLMHLCTSFSILKKKDAEDLVEDPLENGDRKLVVIDCRFGPAHEIGEYINIKSDLACARMEEASTNVENRKAAGSQVLKKAANKNGQTKTAQRSETSETQDDTIPI